MARVLRITQLERYYPNLMREEDASHKGKKLVFSEVL